MQLVKDVGDSCVVEGRKKWQLDVMQALKSAKKCKFFPQAVETWNSENSRVTSLPYLSLTDLLRLENYRFVSTSLVEIAGPSSEPLHFHTSHVIGVVTSGKGMLRHKAVGVSKVNKTEVKQGDVAVIPRGVLHLFHTDIEDHLSYIAFEISTSEIDYQKHWTE